jgi:hypothetical protein
MCDCSVSAITFAILVDLEQQVCIIFCFKLWKYVVQPYNTGEAFEELIMGKNTGCWVVIQVWKWCELCRMPNGPGIYQSASHENVHCTKETVLTNHKVDMMEISFLRPFRTFWMTSECVELLANSCPAPTHSALHVNIWLKTNDSQPETSCSPDSAPCNRFLYLNLEMASKEGSLMMSPRFNKITGCSCQFSNNALHKMRPTVAQALGLLNQTPRTLHWREQHQLEGN